MSLLTPGDLLQCVETFQSGPFGIDRGRIYVCTEVAAYQDFAVPSRCLHGPDCKAGGVRVKEAPCPAWAFWCASCFKPVGRPAAGLIEALQIDEAPEPRAQVWA